MRHRLASLFLIVLIPVAGPLWAAAAPEVVKAIRGTTDPIPADMNWPAWRGNGHGVATKERPQELVGSLDDAKLVWSSEATFGWVASSKDYDVLGGYTNFCLWDGKIYLQHYRGSGDVYKAGLSLEQHIAALKAVKANKARHSLALYGDFEGWARRKAPVLADDVITCIDATNGKTLWEAVMAGKGANWCWVGGLNTFPCTDGERVYFIGTTGRVYAIDAQTGEALWESKLPGFDPDRTRDEALAEVEAMRANAADADPVQLGIRKVQIPFFEITDIVTKPRLIGGVLVTGEKGLAGFDPATGDLRWGPVGAVRAGNPMPWRHGDKEYIISGINYSRHAKGGVICVDPADGRVLWKCPEAEIGIVPPLVVGDILFANGSKLWGGWGHKPAKRKAGDPPPVLPSAWRLSPEGAEKIWEYPGGDRGRTCTQSPVYYQGHVLCKAPGTGTGKESGSVIACIELETGKVKHDTLWRGLMDHTPIKPWNDLIAGNKRLIYGRSKPEYMATLDDFDKVTSCPSKRKPAHGPGGDLVMLVHPVLVDGRLFYRGQYQLFCMDLRAGR